MERILRLILMFVKYSFSSELDVKKQYNNLLEVVFPLPLVPAITLSFFNSILALFIGPKSTISKFIFDNFIHLRIIFKLIIGFVGLYLNSFLLYEYNFLIMVLILL